MKVSILIILSIVLHVNTIKFYRSVRRLPTYRALPCVNDTTIVSVFQEGLKFGYNITISKDLEIESNIEVMFDVLAAVFTDEESANFEEDELQNIFRIKLLKSSSKFTFNVRGDEPPFAPPYMTSLKINGEEFCSEPNVTYFTHFEVGVRSKVVRNCGRTFIRHAELIVHAVNTKAGDWPWHVALHRHNGIAFEYACGGTLLSKFFVLTAAHCTRKDGDPVTPDKFKVELGRYDRDRSHEIGLQKKDVDRIYVHPEYNHLIVNNDIALMKLSQEAVYNKKVQPACLWNNIIMNRIPFGTLGTVVGWGRNEYDELPSQLRSAKMPEVSYNDCLKRRPNYYHRLLMHDTTFCAGYTNGTSVCNGDSGGGFVKFVPDILLHSNTSYTYVPGAFYVKGIVSVTLVREDKTLCDPYTYVVFTDVAKYLPWIHSIIDI